MYKLVVAILVGNGVGGRMATAPHYIFILSYSLSQIMSILNLIETKIGSVHNWPQDILRYLFYIRRPTYFMIVEIVRFLIGNKISREDAFELFDVYSNLSSQCEEILNVNYNIYGAQMRDKVIWPLITT